MDVRISVDATQLTNTFHRIPHVTNKAVARGLTSTAFDIQQSTKQKLPQWLTLTRPYLTRSVVVDKATEQKPVAIVGFTEEVSPRMSLMEKGGIRYPKRSRTIAIPVGVRRRGRPPRPQQVLQRKNTFISEAGPSTGAGIFQALRGGTVRLLYWLTPKTKYTKRFTHFYENAVDVAQKNISKNILRHFDHQINKMKK